MDRLSLLLILAASLALSGCFNSFGRGGRGGGGTPDAGMSDGGFTFPDLGPPPDAGPAAPPPVLLRVMPEGPANDNAPVVVGQTETNARVQLFDNPRCEGPPIGEGFANATGQFQVEITVGDDTTTAIHGIAIAGSREPSICSPDGLTYEEDSTPPDPPVLTGTNPMSPAEELEPVVLGQAEPRSIVRLYRDPDCTETLTLTPVDADGNFEGTVLVTPDTETLIYGTATDVAGNTSECSEPLAYRDLGRANPRLIFPPGPALTDEPELVVRGIVDNPENAVRVLVNDVVATTNDGWANWQATVPLSEGLNTLRLTAEVIGGDVVEGDEVEVNRADLSTFGYSGAAYDPTRDRVVSASVLDRTMYEIDALTGAAGELSGPGVGTGTPLGPVSRLAVDASTGNTFTYDPLRVAVIEVDGDTGDRTDISSASVGGGAPLSFVLGVTAGDGHVYAIQAGMPTSQLIEIDDDTGDRAVLGTVGFGSSALDYDDLSDRIVYFDQPTRSVRAIDQDGVDVLISGAMRGSGPDLAAFIGDIAVDDESGDIVVTDRTDLILIDPATGDREILDLSGIGWPTNSAGNIAIDGDRGIVHVITSVAGNTFTVNLRTDERTLLRQDLVGSGPHLLSLGGVELDAASGRLFVADVSRDAIIEVDRTDGSRSIIVENGTLLGPTGVAVDVPGDRVFAVSPTARLTSFAIGALGPEILSIGGGLSFLPHAEVVWDASDELLFYVSGQTVVEYDVVDRRTRVVSGAGTGGGSPLRQPTGLVLNGDRLLVSGNNQILEIDLATGDRTDVATLSRGNGGAFGQLNGIDLSVSGDEVWAVAAGNLWEVTRGTGDRRSRLLVGSGPVPTTIADVAADPNGEVLWAVGAFPGWLLAIDAETSERVISSW